jgi:hypothetical protein
MGLDISFCNIYFRKDNQIAYNEKTIEAKGKISTDWESPEF